MERRDYVVQFKFTIAQTPGKNNTAADYLSRLEVDPKDKVILAIREDITTKPVEVNFQSNRVAEEEQICFKEDNDETEQEM